MQQGMLCDWVLFSEMLEVMHTIFQSCPSEGMALPFSLCTGGHEVIVLSQFASFVVALTSLAQGEGFRSFGRTVRAHRHLVGQKDRLGLMVMISFYV